MFLILIGSPWGEVDPCPASLVGRLYSLRGNSAPAPIGIIPTGELPSQPLPTQVSQAARVSPPPLPHIWVVPTLALPPCALDYVGSLHGLRRRLPRTVPVLVPTMPCWSTALPPSVVILVQRRWQRLGRQT